MAYNGIVQFVDVSSHLVEWIGNLRFDGTNALIAEIGQFWNCRMERKEKKCFILNYVGRKEGWIRYDGDGGTDVNLQRCVVVGRVRKRHEVNFRYYILVVRQTRSKEYERIGIGMVHANYVSSLGLSTRIV